MVFSTIIFLLRFLPITLALYYLAPPKLKNTVLFLCSLVFYCWGEVRFFPVMLALILINYLCGLGLERFEQNKTARLILLLIALAGSLGMLFYFKYANFVLSSINAIFGTGFAPIQGISVLPLGISFYTFQTLSYSIDVYRRDVKAERNIVDFGAYVVMFPQLIAGPIVKYRDVSDQLHVYKHRYNLKQIEEGMTLFTFGLAKKVLLADNLGVLVNNGWSSLSELTALTAWCVILGYTLQLYFDFSGYCDLAAGCARLLGLRLPINFDSPYRSLSVAEFWKRWHMTLTAFLRENVYFPLGGSRKGRGRTYLNILVVYLVSGIWHGAGWTFILWGLLHGLAQVLERLWGKRRDALPRWVRWAMTFLFINLAWVFFRAPDVSSALLLLKTAVTGGMGGIRLWLVNGLFRREISALELLLPVIVGTTLLVNIVVYAVVSRIVPIQSILDLIRIHTSGRVYAFHKPVGSQIMVSILLMVFWLSAALLPIFSFIRKKASKGDIL